MAALRPSPVTIHPKLPTTITTYATTASLLPRTLRRRRLPALKISLPSITRRRHSAGAAGAVMIGSPAASYATALLDVARSNETLEATIADVEKIEKVFCDDVVQKYFANPTVRVEKKLEIVEEIARAEDLKPHVTNFLYILVDMNRIDLMKEIVKEIEIVYNKITGTEVALVSSVVNLDSQHLSQIAQTMQRFTGAKNVRIKTVIDPSLIAGFTIRYGSSGSKMIDMSVRKQLDELTKTLDLSSITLSES